MSDKIKLPSWQYTRIVAMSPEDIRARDLEVARVALEAAAQAAELWHANGIEVEIARDIRALEFKHAE